MSHPRAGIIGCVVVATALVVCGLLFVPKLRHRPTLPHDSVARAVETHDEKLLEKSAAQQADPNVAGPDGRLPLVIATERGDLALVGRLLDLGANVDAADGSGTTPIMMAAVQGNIELLQKLAGHSQNLQAADAQGRAAVHHAIVAGQAEAVELLMPSVSDFARPIADGRDIVALACESGNASIIRSVLSRAPANPHWTPQAHAALNLALTSKDPELLRLVLSKYAGPPTLEGSTTPLLATAIANDDAELFNLLLGAGADPNTTIPVPAEKSFVTQVKSEDLRDYIRGDDGMSVLMIAAGLGKNEYVRALLDAGAERNRQTRKHKMLALYFAAHSGKPKCIQTLLGRGPTPEELRIEISLATQRASVIKDGIAILQTSISTGRAGFATPAGEYVITDKDRNHRSTIYKVDMPYFMRLNCRDFGMHAGVVPRYPASHGCIRLPANVAEKLFSEIPVGTVVTIN